MDDDLDIEWIKTFENEDKDYNFFYKEPITNIKVYFLYINSKNELDKISEDVFILSNENTINRNELIGLIKSHDKHDNIKYQLLSILNYNIDIDPEHINNYLNQPTEFPFLHSLKHIDTIALNPSISILQDINSIYFLFYEFNQNKSHSTTKKVIISNTRNKTKRKRV